MLPTSAREWLTHAVVGRANLDGSGNTTLVPNAGVLTGITGLYVR